jgi:hypothetical protein
MNPIDNINANIQILRNLNAAPKATLDWLQQWATAHASKFGF